MSEPVIRLQHVSKRFAERLAVDDLSLEIQKGETFVLIGPSGCGKTTTLRVINRLIEATTGTVEVLGQDVRQGDSAELRRRIGYVIQEVGLFPHYTVEQNIGVVPKLLDWAPDSIRQRVRELLDLVNLPRDHAGRYPIELSGGQRQRVGIARALAADPPLVLLDEPFGALDPITREALQDEFVALVKRLEKTLVMVTHDVFEAVRLATRIAVMRSGKLVQVATPATLVHAPTDDFVASLLGRHRYQLRLMTIRLRDVTPSNRPPLGDTDQERCDQVVDLDEASSVWDALDHLERSGARFVRVVSDAGARFYERDDLLDSVKGRA